MKVEDINESVNFNNNVNFDESVNCKFSDNFIDVLNTLFEESKEIFTTNIKESANKKYESNSFCKNEKENVFFINKNNDEDDSIFTKGILNESKFFSNALCKSEKERQKNVFSQLPDVHLLNNEFNTTSVLDVYSPSKNFIDSEKINISFIKKGDEMHLNVQIYPHEGKVNTHIISDNNGKITLILHTACEEMKKILEEKSHSIKKSLCKEGMDVSSILINKNITNGGKNRRNS